MEFEDWYSKEIGVTVADAEALKVYDLSLMRKCWTDSVAAERERIKARLIGMHEATSRHNYYAHAALVLFDRA